MGILFLWPKIMIYNWTKWWIVQLEPLWWVGGLCVSASPPIPCQMRSAKSHNSSSDCKGGFQGWDGAGVIYELLRLRDLPAFIAFYVIVIYSAQYNSITLSTSNSAFLSACLLGLGNDPDHFGGVCTSGPSLILGSISYIEMDLLDCKGFCGSWSYNFRNYVYVSLAWACLAHSTARWWTKDNGRHMKRIPRRARPCGLAVYHMELVTQEVTC